MEQILFATRALAEDYIKDYFEGFETESVSVNIDDFDDDDSMNVIGPRCGERSGYSIYDSNNEEVAIVAWWEEGGRYDIRINGEIVATATYWGLAMQIMRDLAEKEEEKLLEDETYSVGNIDCVNPDGETINVEEI